MKKLLNISASKILIFCTIGLATTLGGFWHLQTNQSQIDRMSVLGQGVGTCFNRISQTFTALMIKDIHSAYLNRGFMGLSDECLNEAISGINPFKQSVGKGHEILNKLISNVHWFHETVIRAHGPMVTGKGLSASMAPIAEKYSEMESLKVNLVDEIDSTITRIRDVQTNTEILTGVGLLIFVFSISFIALKEFNNIQLRKEIQAEALNLLSKGQANIGAMVDRHLDKSLRAYGLNVTAQIFRDYHGEMLERLAIRAPQVQEKVNDHKGRVNVDQEEKGAEEDNSSENFRWPRYSLKEALVSIQNINPKDALNLSEIRDVLLAIDGETLEQMMSAAISKLMDRRQVNKKIVISNQVHADKSIINFFLAGGTFNVTELEFVQNPQAQSQDAVDVNLLILKELTKESSSSWYVENKTDKSGNITGMNIRFIIPRVSKENKSKNLISVVKGKKKNLSKEMMN